MKKILCMLFSALILLSSCGQTGPVETQTANQTETEKTVTAAEKQTEPETEEETLPENVREEDGVLIYETEDYSIKFPKGFAVSYDGMKLTLSPKDGKARYVTVEKTGLDFSERLSYKETAEAVAASLSSTLDSEPEKIELGGVYCVRFGFAAGGVHVTGYIFDHEGKTYIMCAASEDDNDGLPVRIAQTIKFNTKESSDK